ELAHAPPADLSIELAAVVDINPSRATRVAQQVGTRAFTSVAELLAGENIHAASVAVPTTEHLAVAHAIMQAGIDVLIEKPLAPSLAEADELIATARRTGRVAQVGHLERFNPAVRAAVPLITQPMFFEVHRLSVFTRRALDVDVVLDLMIHDLDIVLAFVGSPVKEVRAVGLPILSGKVDIANVRMEFDSGCVANFTASRVSTERVRKLRFFQPRQYISIDYTRQDVLVFTVEPSASLAADPALLERPAQAQAPTAQQVPHAGLPIRVEKPATQHEEPLRAELRSFLEAVRQRSAPLISLEDGRRALALALEVLEKIREHSRRLNLESLNAVRPR
ncbi:MAG TPA: Gfo/Idh/MocA family oxidoreductase, partial [Chloroflexota bacterium]|nr:Gfo/Idh/MocA family oxidoreductase [Chloroflexota bacterium]